MKLAAAVAALALLGASAHPPEEAGYVDASMVFDGELLDFRFVDVLDAPGPELVAVVLRADGRRTLRVHVQDGRGFDARPRARVDVLEDVIAHGFADVRADPGPELLLLTRSGAYSYSLTKAGYRDNIARLVEAPLLFDVPDPRELPYWPYVLPGRRADRVLLPERGGFAVFGPREAADGDEVDPQVPSYERTAAFDAFDVPAGALGAGAATRDRRDESAPDDDARVRVEWFGRGDGPLLSELDGGESLLSDAKGYAAPALADVDGDGARDLLVLTEEGLRVHLSDEGRFRAEPDRLEPFPDYLSVDPDREESVVLRLADLDGDGDPDLLGSLERGGDAFENSDVDVLLLLNDGRRLLPERPDQVLRFEAAVLRTDVVDANGDGRPDLFLRKFDLPSVVDTVTGLEFKMTYLLFLGDDARGRVVERRPKMRQEESFDENSVAEVVKFRELEHDCDGDGRPDLVELDLQGRIAIRRLRFDSGFFTGDTWELEREPWKRFDVRGDVRRLEVRDLNGDGRGDVASLGTDGLTLLMSTGGRR